MTTTSVLFNTIARSGSCKIKVRGITLIEMMIVLAITAIVMFMAVPTFSAAIVRSRMTSYTNEFLSYLSFARNEAITRGQRVIVCKSKDGISCTTNNFGWEQGWIVFVDRDDNTQVSVGEILRVHDKLYGNITLQGNGPVSDYVGYSSDGRTRTNTRAFQAGTLSICDNSGSGLKDAIKISMMGRVRTDNNCKFCPSPYSPCTECTASCP